MKIDIEGYEPYVLKGATKLFQHLDIRVVFMEWGQISQKMKRENERVLNEPDIVYMIEFFVRLQYMPMANNIILNLNEWRKWPWDILWLKH